MVTGKKWNVRYRMRPALSMATSSCLIRERAKSQVLTLWDPVTFGDDRLNYLEEISSK